MSHPSRKALVLSHFNFGINRVFEDYCEGIRANVDNYHYIDYIETYFRLGCRGFEKEIELFVEKQQINHIFLIWWSCDLTFNPGFLARLSSRAKIVMNFFDTEYFFEGVDRYYAQFADLVVLPDELSRYRYEHLCIPSHTSFALFDRNAYRIDGETEQDIDVSFVGNLKQADRAEYVQYLRDHGVKVETYGVGSDHGFVSFEQMTRIFNRSRINLNFTGTASFNNYAIDLPRINQRIKQSKGRPIEIALCGGFILTQYAVGIEKMFSPGKDFDIFHSKEELLAMVRHYLEHDSQRTEMAQQGHLKAVANYDALAGFKIIFDRLDSMSKPNQTDIYLDHSFQRNYSSFRFFYIAIFFLNGRLARVVEELMVAVRVRRIDPIAAYHFSTRGALHFLREHPRAERIFKRVRRWLPLKLKY